MVADAVESASRTLSDPTPGDWKAWSVTSPTSACATASSMSAG